MTRKRIMVAALIGLVAGLGIVAFYMGMQALLPQPQSEDGVREAVRELNRRLRRAEAQCNQELAALKEAGETDGDQKIDSGTIARITDKHMGDVRALYTQDLRERIQEQKDAEYKLLLMLRNCTTDNLQQIDVKNDRADVMFAKEFAGGHRWSSSITFRYQDGRWLLGPGYGSASKKQETPAAKPNSGKAKE